MKTKLLAYTFIASLAASSLMSFSAHAEDGKCSGYFQYNVRTQTGKYVLTDSVPASVLAKEGDLVDVMDEGTPDYLCVPTLQKVLAAGGVRLWNETVTTVMKLQIHPEEEENVIALLSDVKLSPNPRALKIRYSSKTEKNGTYTFIVTVSKK